MDEAGAFVVFAEAAPPLHLLVASHVLVVPSKLCRVRVRAVPVSERVVLRNALLGDGAPGVPSPTSLGGRGSPALTPVPLRGGGGPAPPAHRGRPEPPGDDPPHACFLGMMI